MDAKLEALLKAGFEATYSLERLAEPFSIRSDGTIATVEDALREFGTDEVRAAFSLPAPDGTKHVKSINELTEDELCVLTLALYEQDGDDGLMTATGGKTYSMDDIVDEVRRRTPFGRETMEALRRLCMLEEEAIRRGKVKLVPARKPGLEFPDL